MTDVLFYHLTESNLEAALPTLLEKSLERGWKVVVQAGSQEKVEALDAHLWTYREDSFLAHGATSDGTQPMQPIWLTTEQDNPNGANIRFLVDGAVPSDLAGYERAVYMFDGHDNDAVLQARERWKIEKEAGFDLTYWQQKPNGGWEKKA
ncbi:MAG: DNA polymerase III subunit chi [Rhizobiaceae bacterium]|nr:DNA polymerase III subunit chi [Rhizobiaceae bacterium]